MPNYLEFQNSSKKVSATFESLVDGVFFKQDENEKVNPNIEVFGTMNRFSYIKKRGNGVVKKAFVIWPEMQGSKTTRLIDKSNQKRFEQICKKSGYSVEFVENFEVLIDKLRLCFSKEGYSKEQTDIAFKNMFPKKIKNPIV